MLFWCYFFWDLVVSFSYLHISKESISKSGYCPRFFWCRDGSSSAIFWYGYFSGFFGAAIFQQRTSWRLWGDGAFFFGSRYTFRHPLRLQRALRSIVLRRMGQVSTVSDAWKQILLAPTLLLFSDNSSAIVC